MKGIVFNLLEEVVSRQYGAETWDSLLGTAGLDGSYTALGNYKDEELAKLVKAASDTLKMGPQEVVRWFGRESVPLLAQKYPGFFDKHASARPFVLSLNGIIHPEVRALYPGADTPEFVFDASSPDVLVMQYQSARKLCAFAEGLIQGTAAYYGETVIIEHCRCMHRGDDRCHFDLRFRQKAAAA